MKVYVDTNGWLRCAALRIDLWEELKRIVPGTVEIIAIDKVMHELEGLKSAGGTLAREAKLAIELIKLKRVSIQETDGHARVDDVLVQICQEHNFVLTQDQELKRRLKNRHVGIIVIRSDSHLMLENR
jgi:rRNA-processing protein FCF1